MRVSGIVQIGVQKEHLGSYASGCNFIRYADDFVCAFRYKEDARLEETIFDRDEISAICNLIGEVFAEETSLIDVAVVRDALILATPDRQGDADLQTLSAEGAQMIV